MISKPSEREQKALSNEDRLAAAFDFWSEPELWPGDTSEKVFLARALDKAGRAKFSDQWTGRELVERFLPQFLSGIPYTLGFDGPFRWYLEEVVGAHIAPADQLKFENDFEKVSAALDAYEQHEKLAREYSLRRAGMVLEAAWRALRDGALKSSTLPFEGDGKFRSMPASAWRTDAAPYRFEYCIVNRNDMNNRETIQTSPSEWKMLLHSTGLQTLEHMAPSYIFVSRESLMEWIAGLNSPGGCADDALVLHSRKLERGQAHGTVSTTLLERFLRTYADGHRTEAQCKQAAQAHFEGKRIPDKNVWRVVWRGLPPEMRRPRGPSR